MTGSAGQKLWQQAKEVFTEYVAMSEADATSKLALRSDLDPEVRVRVARLIQAMGKSRTLLDHADSGHIFHQIKQLSDMSGQHIDHYELKELIAVGGMSSIYRAKRMDSAVQKPVAIKVMSMLSGGTDVITLFNRELKALSKLNHQNIVAFYHGGQSTSGVYYLVMELIEQAITIDHYIAKHGCDVKATVALIRQVALAMVNAHDHLIIHGDLKSDNILMDINNQLKVVDFGIAAFTYQNHQDHAPVFTPSIASPEQVQGESITIKSDIYSLGATLLQLLTGQAPQPEYRVETYQPDQVTGHAEALMEQANLDQELVHIIRKTMQQNPAERYVTMNDFAADLGRWQANKPVQAMAGGRLYHLRKFAVRNRWLTLGFMMLLSVLLVAMVVVQNYAVNAKNEAHKAQTTLDFMTRVLSQADPAHVDQGNTTIREAFKITLNQSDEYLNQNPESQINILTQVTDIYTELALYGEAAETAEKIHRAYQLTKGANSEEALHWLYEAAGHYHAAGAFEQCLTLGHQVISTLDQAALSYPSVRLNALNAIIKCHVERYENEAAIKYMNVAHDLMESGRIQDQEALGRTYNSFAVITRRQHQFELSEAFYLKSLENIAASLGKDNTAYATILNGYGRMLMLQDRYQEAKPYLLESMQRVESFDPDSHVLARNMSYYAKYLFHTGSQKQAIDLLNTATQIADKRSHQFTLMIIQDLRYEYNNIMGDLTAAMEAHLLRLEIAIELYGRNHDTVTMYLDHLAQLLSLMGIKQQAEEVWLGLLAFDEQFPNEQRVDAARIQAYLGINELLAVKSISTGNKQKPPSKAAVYLNSIQAQQSGDASDVVLALLLGQSVDGVAVPETAVGGQVIAFLLAQQRGAARDEWCEKTSAVYNSTALMMKKVMLAQCESSNHTPPPWQQLRDAVATARQQYADIDQHEVQRVLALLP